MAPCRTLINYANNSKMLVLLTYKESVFCRLKASGHLSPQNHIDVQGKGELTKKKVDAESKRDLFFALMVAAPLIYPQEEKQPLCSPVRKLGGASEWHSFISYVANAL